jgi:hypothetical protein
LVAATTMSTAAAMSGTAETTSDAWALLAANPAKRMEALKTQWLPGKSVLVRLDLNAPLRFNEATAALEVKYSTTSGSYILGATSGPTRVVRRECGVRR